MSWDNSGTKFGKLYVIAHQKWYDALFWEIGFPVYRLVAVYWYSFYVMNDMHHQTRDSTLNVVLYVINGKKFWKSFLCMVMPSILRYAEFNHTGLPEAIDLSNFSTAWKHAITIYYGKYKFIIQFSCAFQSFLCMYLQIIDIWIGFFWKKLDYKSKRQDQFPIEIFHWLSFLRAY